MTKTFERQDTFEFDFDHTKEVVKKTTSTAAKKFSNKLNGFYMFIGAVSLALTVYMSIGIFAAAERDFNGGFGGEVILAAGVFFGIRFLWKKIKRKLK